MLSLGSSRRKHGALVLCLPWLALVLILCLFSSHRLYAPSSWFRSGSFWTSDKPASPRSGWLSTNGFLRLDDEDPFASSYTIAMRPEILPVTLWNCDRMRSMGSVSRCDNTMAYVSLLRDLRSPLARGTQEFGDIATDGSVVETASHAGYSIRPPTLDDLAGKRTLILGDSVDRYMLTHLRDDVLNDTRYFSGCEMDDSDRLIHFDTSQGSARMVVIPIERGSEDPATIRHTPFDFANDVQVNSSPVPPLVGREDIASLGARRVDEKARSQLRIDFLHMYGTDDDDLWEDRQSHHLVTAWRTRDRLEKVKSMWGHGPGVYDTIFLNFGLWELARYQRTAYATHGNDDELGLPLDWLEDYKERLGSYVSLVQTIWSGSKVVIRTLHDPRQNAGGWFRPAGMDLAGDHKAPFTRLRVVQLRRAQLQVAREIGVDVLPWADHMSGQDDDWLRDEIHPNVPGSLVLAEMYLRFLSAA